VTIRIANPRLVDAFELSFSQDDVDFAIPHLREDIPLCIDPFLMWSSEDPSYRVLHTQLLAFFEQLRALVKAGRDVEASRLLLTCEEPKEFGLGYALGSKRGSAVGPELGRAILALYHLIPQLGTAGLSHIEEIQLLVPGVAEDRMSDLTACILKGYFLDYTAECSRQYGLPTKSFRIPNVYDHGPATWRAGVQVSLPYNPLDGSPLILTPLNLLRHLPWINYEDYYSSYYAPYVLPPDRARRKIAKPAVLAYNRANYVAVQRYVEEKEREGYRCKPDPLFQPLASETLKHKFVVLRSLTTGNEQGNDRKYAEWACDLLSSLLYPELEFADSQVRTASGAHIRDLIFYNDGKTEFLRDLRDRFDARQIVFELKNVRALSPDDVNQLYRYLSEQFGRFGVLTTRNPPPRAVGRNIIDLHSSKRCAILCFDDSDFDLMLNLAESRRRPIEALKKRFVEFTRLLPT
jgi:hypothetical protein